MIVTTNDDSYNPLKAQYIYGRVAEMTKLGHGYSNVLWGNMFSTVNSTVNKKNGQR